MRRGGYCVVKHSRNACAEYASTTWKRSMYKIQSGEHVFINENCRKKLLEAKGIATN